MARLPGACFQQVQGDKDWPGRGGPGPVGAPLHGGQPGGNQKGRGGLLKVTQLAGQAPESEESRPPLEPWGHRARVAGVTDASCASPAFLALQNSPVRLPYCARVTAPVSCW